MGVTMTNHPNDDNILQAIAELRSDVEHVDDMLDSEKRLVRSARLVERIIKRHFLRDSTEKKGLRTLIQLRKRFLGGKGFEDAAFAVGIRNRISHDSLKGDPTDEQMKKASDVFLNIVRRHLQVLERRAGSNARDSDVDHDEGSVDDDELQPAAKPVTPIPPEVLVTHVDRKPRPLLDALDTDPAVTASTVAEYDFCPRAGILTHEGDYSDPEEELPSHWLLPWYEQDAIEEKYARSCLRLFWLLVGFVVGLVVLAISPLIKLTGFPLILLLGVGLWVYFAILEFGTWRTLGERRLAAHSAVACELNPNSDSFQAVDWWGLLLAGFDVRRPKDALKDAKWKLSGLPRRILDKGSMTIPVHRIRKQEGPLAPQHITRVMTHCHLIEAAEGAVSPFAVVLFGNTYQGTTVPNLRNHRERFYTALDRVRTMIQESDAGERQPPEPVTGSICSKCPHGCPRPAVKQVKTMRYGEPLEPYLFFNSKGKAYHCDCGDRFRWKPKHERNARLRRLE
jgi:hypothetical protein